MSDANHGDGGEKDSHNPESQLDGTVHAPPTVGDTLKHETSNQAELKTDPLAAKSTEIVGSGQRGSVERQNTTSWFAIPAPLKRLFDRFPLVAYAENELPVRASRKRAESVLYIFTDDEGAAYGRASFNPSCLKWQTYLHAAGIEFRTVSSNNHASPSGSLPFLLVGNQSTNSSIEATTSIALPEVVPGSRLRRWAKDRKAIRSNVHSEDFRHEVYSSLLDNRIRKAWLYQLYLHPANATMLKRLYVEPCSSNPLVQITISSQLRSAAESEIIKASKTSGSTVEIKEAQIMRDADEAFAALSTLLGNAPWFFDDQPTQQTNVNAQQGPGLFDASVFAYTHLILASTKDNINGILGWECNPLKALLQQYDNLIDHRERVSHMYY